jgi:hypothetical protein
MGLELPEILLGNACFKLNNLWLYGNINRIRLLIQRYLKLFSIKNSIAVAICQSLNDLGS